MTRATTVSYSSVQELAERLALSADAYSRAMELSGLAPDRGRWLRYIDRFLAAVGVLLLLVGIAAFFAWNWHELGPMHKFALIQGGVLAAVLAVWRFGLDTVMGRASLLAAAVLAGICLAVFGQVYQTGADPYGLFVAWALLILPWAIIGRQAGVWLLLVVLLNLAAIMYYTQVLHPPDGWWQLTQLLGPLVWLTFTVTDSVLASGLFVLNVLALVAWEFAASRGVGWMRGTVFPRLIALLALGAVVVPTLLIVVAASFDERARLSVISPLLMFAASAGCLYYYRYRRPDLFILTCCLLGTILVVTALAVRFMLGSGGLLLLAMLLIAQIAAAAWWLRRVAEDLGAEA